MTSQPMTHENIVIISANGINFPQTEKPVSNNQKQDNLWKYLKSNIRCIGSIQIMCGVIILSLGIILVSAPSSPYFSKTFFPLLKTAHPFIGSLCLIISGLLSIITERKTTKILVQCSVATNIMSSLSGIVGFIILSINLTALGPVTSKCLLDEENKPKETHYYHHQETDYCSMSKIILTGTLSMMLICTVLEFGLAALTATVWWKHAQFDFPGSVRFMPKDTFSPKARSSSTYQELLT
ncbi:membrane-spanning 4-domains subfamily A member 6A-like [Sorex fumeus]|uniref:membrane-spanning 4-domains subfamily A member 6A-like n=1 Tax=Sorex fumeus TaxID=62283 RepID=UPI0024AD7953|nr:membrane-spanning 4-domains subfamily A member 6A-like [Sorex fumeus]